jgi:1-acyl-sn-glycerol-3-phosphate acyltransferase
VFPEGTRGTGPKIGQLFDGASYLAARCGVPLVPVGIGGSEGILDGGLPRPRRVAVVVGEPIQPPRRDGPARRPAIARMTDELVAELQRCFDRALDLAG